MKAKEYDVLRRAVEDGVRYGLHRAVKYGDVEEAVYKFVEEAGTQDAIVDAVLNEVCEWFGFENERYVEDGEMKDPAGEEKAPWEST